MSKRLLLTFNAGSSTVKIGVFDIETGVARRIAKGMLDFRAQPVTFRFLDGPNAEDITLGASHGEDLHDIVAETFDWLAQHFHIKGAELVGHRVVHGGDAFAGPAMINDDTLAQMDALTALAPLHQPQALRLIRAVRRWAPSLPQAASFDTAFHRSNDDLVRRFALPRALYDQGVKRYGFHGLSYKFIAGAVAKRLPVLAQGKIVAAHLGSGASLCGMDAGVSKDSSMGFSTLDGVPMATRCGALDPGVMLHLLGAGGMSQTELEQMLYHRSGLLGLSGISADARVLLESDRAEAQQALDIFALRCAGEIARLSASIGGLDAIVFTAGVGENAAAVRANVLARLAWLGVEPDAAANAANAFEISTPNSRVKALVIATDEEQVIADEALSLSA